MSCVIENCSTNPTNKPNQQTQPTNPTNKPNHQTQPSNPSIKPIKPNERDMCRMYRVVSNACAVGLQDGLDGVDGLYGWDGLDSLDVCAKSKHYWTRGHRSQHAWPTWDTASYCLLGWHVVAVLVVASLASLDWSSWHGCHDDWSDLSGRHLVCGVCGWAAGLLHEFDCELVGWLANICNHAFLQQIKLFNQHQQHPQHPHHQQHQQHQQHRQHQQHQHTKPYFSLI